MTIVDYINVLNYYNMDIPASKKQIRIDATNVLGDKLCKCIKKIDTVNEARSIGICTKSVFGRKGLTRGKFSCTGKRLLKFRKTRTTQKNMRKK